MQSSVLIIGGGSGIGLALTQHFAQQGMQVTVISRRAPPENVTWQWYQDELQDDATTEHLLQQALLQRPGQIFICNGVLHDAQAMPEKTIRQLSNDVLLSRLQTNVAVPARYLQLLFGYLAKTADVRLLVLSAKVGSISDNSLGGWYSYRISKAALNMLVKTFSIELSRLNKTAAVVTVHPGTTDTALSAPFQANLPSGQLQTGVSTAARLAAVAAMLQPQHSGALLNWDGSVLPF